MRIFHWTLSSKYPDTYYTRSVLIISTFANPDILLIRLTLKYTVVLRFRTKLV